MSSPGRLMIPPQYWDSPVGSVDRLGPVGCAVDTFLSPGTTVSRHRHACYEAIIVYSGVAVLLANGSREILTRGDIAIFHGGTLHGTRSVSGLYLRTAIHFVSDFVVSPAQTILPTANEGPKVFSLPAKTLDELLREARKLRWLTEVGEARRSRTVLSKILGVINSEQRHPPRRLLPPILQPIVQYMVSHPEKTYTTEDLARKFHVSEGHLYRLFQQHLGCTPQKLWLHIKIESACDMLINGMNVEQTAGTTGFTTRRGFERAFHRITGFSPASYRKTILKRIARTS